VIAHLTCARVCLQVIIRRKNEKQFAKHITSHSNHLNNVAGNKRFRRILQCQTLDKAHHFRASHRFPRDPAASRSPRDTLYWVLCLFTEIFSYFFCVSRQIIDEKTLILFCFFG
jgi:hypothetical protein